jgi:hypothetical protein
MLMVIESRGPCLWFFSISNQLPPLDYYRAGQGSSDLMATLRLVGRGFRGTDLKFSRTAPSTRHLSSTPTRSPVRTALYATTFAVSAGLFAVYYFDARSAIHRYFIAPLLRYALDAETGHKVAVKVLRSGLGPRDPLPDDERLRFQVRRWIFSFCCTVANCRRVALGAGCFQPSRTGSWVRQGRRGD